MKATGEPESSKKALTIAQVNSGEASDSISGVVMEQSTWIQEI